MTDPTAQLPAVPPETGGYSPPPGWYPDPWIAGHHRYWTGETWSADSFPSLQTATTPAPIPSGPSADHATPQSSKRRLPSGPALAAILLVIGLIVGFGIAFGVTSAVRTTTSSAPVTTVPAAPTTTPGASTPGTLTPGSSGPSASSGAPTDPQTPALSSVILRQADVPTTLSVVLIPGGDQVQRQTTLDLCNGTFVSETLRTARRQVAAVDAQGSAVLSTEAVLYRDPAGSAQAFAELRAAARCPSTPVTSPVGEPTVTTHFNPTPDGSWPQIPNVERLAYDFVTTDQSGQTQHSVAVYLRHGRALLAVYFSTPDGAQPAISGQTTIGGIVNVLTQRLAQLPISVTG